MVPMAKKAKAVIRAQAIPRLHAQAIDSQTAGERTAVKARLTITLVLESIKV